MSQENQAMKRLQNLLIKIRDERNSMSELFGDSSIACFKIDNQKRIIFGLRTTGCSWVKHGGGGCVHCGVTKENTFDSDQIYNQFLEEFSKVDFYKYPTLCLYTPGSFFDYEEIPNVLRIKLFSLISKEYRIKKLILETRPEFVYREEILELRKILPDLDIEVGIGLDTINDRVRSLCLNKGFNLKTYKMACNILRDHGINILSYIVIKPPFLNEKESIDDAIESSKKAFELGSSAVSLEPLSVQKFTLVGNLYKLGLYHPPWLWSVIEIAKAVSKYGETRIGQFSYPPPLLVPENCKKCTILVSEKIKEFNNTGNIEVFENLDCDCWKIWRRDLDKKLDTNLSSRVLVGITMIEKALNNDYCYRGTNKGNVG